MKSLKSQRLLLKKQLKKGFSLNTLTNSQDYNNGILNLNSIQVVNNANHKAKDRVKTDCFVAEISRTDTVLQTVN